ncbi:MAG: hypothetical protein ACK5KM_03065 [Hyphomicrobiaceae bacterium]
MSIAAAAFIVPSMVVLPALLLAQGASAATLTNRDATEHTVWVTSGGSDKNRTLEPNEAWSDFCPAGCVVRLREEKDVSYRLEGTERISIEDGFIYYERENTGLAPQVPPAEAPERR